MKKFEPIGEKKIFTIIFKSYNSFFLLLRSLAFMWVSSIFWTYHNRACIQFQFCRHGHFHCDNSLSFCQRFSLSFWQQKVCGRQGWGEWLLEFWEQKWLSPFPNFGNANDKKFQRLGMGIKIPNFWEREWKFPFPTSVDGNEMLLFSGMIGNRNSAKKWVIGFVVQIRTVFNPTRVTKCQFFYTERNLETKFPPQKIRKLQ